MSATVITVTAWDLCTNVLLTNLQAVAPTYTIRLNDAGACGFALDLTDGTTSQQAAVIRALGDNPFKVIFSDPDGNIQFAGIAWTNSMGPTSPLMTFTGTMLTGYFAQVFATQSYTTSISPAQLLANVITNVQSHAAANIHITPRLALTSPPPPFTPSYNVTQYIRASQILSDVTMGLTPGEGGVDYYETDVFINDVPNHFFNIAAPRCGVVGPASGWVIDLTRAIDWSRTADATQTGNGAVVVGSGTGSVQPVATQSVTVPRGGLGQMPLLQQLYQYSRITSQTHLQAIANGAIAMYGMPVVVYTVTLPVDYAPCPLGGFGIGDDIQLTSPKNAYFPSGLSQTWRIVSCQVTYPTEGVPTMILTLNLPPLY